jgi:hypothetical protein
MRGLKVMNFCSIAGPGTYTYEPKEQEIRSGVNQNCIRKKPVFRSVNNVFWYPDLVFVALEYGSGYRVLLLSSLAFKIPTKSRFFVIF